MRKNSKETDSYRRRKPADEAVKGIDTSGKTAKDSKAADKAARNAEDNTVRDTDTKITGRRWTPRDLSGNPVGSVTEDECAGGGSQGKAGEIGG